MPDANRINLQHALSDNGSHDSAATGPHGDPTGEVASLVGELLLSDELKAKIRELKKANLRLREDKPGALAGDAQKHAAEELAKSVEHLFGEMLTRVVQKALKRLQNELAAVRDELQRRDAALALLTERLATLEAASRPTLEALHRLEAMLKLLTDGGNLPDEISYCLPPGPAQHRFRTLSVLEKRRLAKYVTNQYFDRRRRCFVQASTFAMHLAESLRRHKPSRASLFHTNSECFAPAMLAKEQAWQVYPIAGRHSDPLCMGWYLSASDVVGEQYVRELFTRDVDPLEFAILTPQFLTADGHLHFRLDDARNFVQLVASVAPHLVIVTPAERIYEDAATMEAERPEEPCSELALRELLEERRTQGSIVVDYVVCGEFRPNVDPLAFERSITAGLGASVTIVSD